MADVDSDFFSNVTGSDETVTEDETDIMPVDIIVHALDVVPGIISWLL